MPSCPLATISYWTVEHACRFPIGHPLQHTDLLLATRISKYLPLFHPHSAAVSTFFHASRRRYFIAVIKHVPAERDFVPRSSTAIGNLALPLVIATHTSCRSARVVLHHNSERVACGLRFSSSYIQYYCFTNLYSGTLHARPAHNPLAYSVQHVFPAHRWTERSSR